MQANLSLRDAPVFTGNLVGIVVSLLLHATIVFIMVYNWTPSKEERQAIRPQYIEAKLLQLKPPAVQPQQPKATPPPQPREDTAARQRVEEQQKREQQAKQEAERQKQEVARQQELQRQQQLKQEADRKRQEELKRQEEQKREQEAARQQELKRQQEIQRQQELARALAMEEAMLEDEMLDEQVGTYTGYMAGLIASNWSRPPSATRDMEVVLQISLASAGRVSGVQVVKSSGSSAFDRSAEQAVWKVSQFSRLAEMDPALYQSQFRRVTLVFRPDDLRK